MSLLFMALPLAIAVYAMDSDEAIIAERLVVKDQGYFPVAQRLMDGRIAVVLRGGAPHLGIAGRLDMVFSSDDGKNWSPPRVVDDSPIDDRNPAFGQAADGSLVVSFWRTARYDDKGKYSPNRTDKPVSTWTTRSVDGGKTWDRPTEIDVREIGYGSPYGKIIALPDRSLLMAVYGHQPRRAGEEVKSREDWSYLFHSTDHGVTWKLYSTVASKRFNETSVLLLRSGRMIAAMRSSVPEQAVWLSESTNLGKTWSEPIRLTPAKHHPADLIELTDGRVLLTIGKRTGALGVVALVSDSEGKFDWSKHTSLVADAANGDCGYPSSVALSQDRALTFYYAVGRKEKADWRAHCGVVEHRIPAKEKNP
jgi:sialidase-1